MSIRVVSWTKSAAVDFIAAIEYIRRQSDSQADKVKQKILEKISLLSDEKIVHRVDPYKIDNDGRYLYFEYLKFRIVYFVATPNQVYIIRIRHTSREPKRY